MKNYQEWYDHIAGNIENKNFLLSLLKSFNRFMTVVMPIVYLTLLAITYLQEGLEKQVLMYVFVPASGFVFCPFFVRKSMPLGLMRNGILNPCLTEIVLVSLCPVVMSFQQPLSPWLAYMLVYL